MKLVATTVFALVVACTAAQGTQAINTIPDALKCGADITADLLGVPNIPQTLADCGLTIDQLIAIWTSQQNAVDAGAVGASASSQQLQKAIDAAKAYKAQHPN
jgi:hypothetical protein